MPSGNSLANSGILREFLLNVSIAANPRRDVPDVEPLMPPDAFAG